jgi:uncharacterized membrane protein
MTTLERSIVIKATTEAIDAVTLDGNRLPEWYTGMQEARADDLYPKVGGSVETTYRAAGINFKVKITSVELVPGQSITLKMEGMITGANRWVYQPEGEATRVTASLDYEMPGGGLGQALNKLVVEKMNTENLEKSLSNLKVLVESGK